MDEVGVHQLQLQRRHSLHARQITFERIEYLRVELKELDQVINTHVAALAGSAPIAEDAASGTARVPQQGGRSQVRPALSMAAVGAIRAKNTPVLKFAMPPSSPAANPVAITTIMRSMITALNAMARDNRPWNPRHAA